MGFSASGWNGSTEICGSGLFYGQRAYTSRNYTLIHDDGWKTNGR